MADEVKTRKRSVPEPVEHEYVSTTTDVGLTAEELSELNSVRGEVASMHVDFLNEMDANISGNISVAYTWMVDPSKNPFSGLRLPENLSQTTLDELVNLQAKIANAFIQFGELLSAIRAMNRVRLLMYDRRKSRAGINEGTNDSERKALAGLRAFPEESNLARSDVLLSWVETRYFMFQRLLDTVNQMVTTKSVEQTRSMKDEASHERMS